LLGAQPRFRRMPLEYFARWSWPQRRGLGSLSGKKAAQRHEKGASYVVHLPEERLILTLRSASSYLEVATLGPDAERLAGVAMLLGDDRRIESIDVRHGGAQVVHLQGGHGTKLYVTDAPFDDPKELEPRPLPSVIFPAFGELDAAAALPRDPWAYVVLPPGFDPPQPWA
jgi:hypothetical protein